MHSGAFDITNQKSGPDTPAPETLVIVLGMHRSGTSLATHILSQAGFYAGAEKDLIKGGKWNEEGYFERWDVLKANDEILHRCGGSWFQPPGEERLLALNADGRLYPLLSYYDGHPLAVIKDPRLCLTFPVWKRVLPPIVKILRVSRNPEDAASSLMKRFNNLSLQFCLKLGEIYTRRAAAYSKGYPTLHVQYEDLLSAARQPVLKQLSQFLGLETDLAEIANTVIKPGLRHFGGGLAV
ncbi:MAG: sulfotransferase [Thermodesulfobacteriota bacterium]|nr:sulfotransferase [Thermodesulfobacteriota bacterium]